jgi:hypothetical protein
VDFNQQSALFICAIGDCAYLPTAHLIPIFGGAQAKSKNMMTLIILPANVVSKLKWRLD